MPPARSLLVMMTLLLPLLSAAAAEDGHVSPTPDGRCDSCGGRDGVVKVCVPKMTEREVKKTCWGVKCEDFCVPGPSVRCGIQRGEDACGCWSHELWRPTCAQVRTKRVPVKTEVKRKVPAVEWKLEERCAACRSPAAGPGCATEQPR